MLDEQTAAYWSETAAQPTFYLDPADPDLVTYSPRVYGDTPSFLEAPVAWQPEELQGIDAVFLGIPWEGARQLTATTWAKLSSREPAHGAVVGRYGAFQAPEMVRKWSINYSLQHSGAFHSEVAPDFRLADHLSLRDYRDVAFEEWNIEDMARQARAKVADIVKAGAIPLVIGGDHSIPYPVVRAISDNTPGKIGIIDFDTHFDLEYGGRLNAGNQFARIFESCQVEPTNMVQIGIQGSAVLNTPLMSQVAQHLGITVFTSADVERLGIEEVMTRAIEIAGRGTEKIYVTLDVDSLDPATFPAQKYSSAFGLTARQVKRALGMVVQRANLAGFDICCMGPAYDHNGLGLMTACRFYLEILFGLALRKSASNA